MSAPGDPGSAGQVPVRVPEGSPGAPHSTSVSTKVNRGAAPIAWAAVACIAELAFAAAWLTSQAQSSPVFDTGTWFLLIVVAPLVALGASIGAVKVGRRSTGALARGGFWAGVVALIVAIAWVGTTGWAR